MVEVHADAIAEFGVIFRRYLFAGASSPGAAIFKAVRERVEDWGDPKVVRIVARKAAALEGHAGPQIDMHIEAALAESRSSANGAGAEGPQAARPKPGQRPDRQDWIDRARGIPILDEVTRRAIKLKGKSAEREGPCPRCGGTDRFSINTTKNVFNCRQCGKGGDVIDLVMFLDGVDFNAAAELLAGQAPRKKEARRDFKNRVTFDYHDAEGCLIYHRDRIPKVDADGRPLLSDKGKPDKEFMPRLAGESKYGLKGLAEVPYRLHELVAAIAADRSVPVFVAEGERKADLLRSWGYTATNITQGTRDYAEVFRGADVVILPDNDEMGRKRAAAVLRALDGVAERLRVLELPGLADGEDVEDWVRRGNTRETLEQLVDQARKPPPGRFAPVWLNEIKLDDGPACLIEGLMPVGPCFGVVFGPPGSLKTFLLNDALLHVAQGKAYFNRAVQKRIVVYVTSEAVIGVKHRLIAMRRFHNIEGDLVPFALVSTMPNLGTGTTDLDELCKEIERAIKPFAPLNLGAIALDTLRRATPGKSESDSKDMSIFVENSEALARRFGCVVPVVHHSPRSDDTRSSGSNAIDGASNFMWGVFRDGKNLNATATLARFKDGSDDGIAWGFKVVPGEIGHRRDGSPIMSCYVVPAPAVPREQGKRPPKGIATMQAALAETFTSCGQDIQVRGGPIVRGVPVEDVRREFLARYITGETDPKLAEKACRKAWLRQVDKLPVSFAAQRHAGKEWIVKL